MASPENKTTPIPANFCINPFVKINVMPTGTISPCCAFVSLFEKMADTIRFMSIPLKKSGIRIICAVFASEWLWVSQ